MGRTLRRLALLAFMAIVASATAAAFVYWRTQQPYRGYVGAEQFVDIPPGSSTKSIGDRLIAAGVVRDPLTYRVAVSISGRARSLQAGEYRFDQPMTPLDVIGKIARGEVHAIAVTFPEGLTMAEMAAIAESNGVGPASAFTKAAKDPAPIRRLDPTARDLEGYLFPETYRLRRGAGPEQLVRMMVERFERVLSPEMRRTADARGLSIHQLVTLASLVEEETARPAERPVVAAVYLNRFRIGMPMQADPTVIYALQREGKFAGNLRRDDLAFDSPYNTYRYPGLPPGPIASPGRASLQAVLDPADEKYLYFVSRNDGSHAFATTLPEHNSNVQKYQVDYFKGR